MAVRTRLILRKTLKVLHEIGSVGVLGAFAASLVLIACAPSPHELLAYAAARQGIAAIARWLLVPSLALVLISGMLAMVANDAYMEAGWAWIKALLGLSMFEGSLVTVSGSARHAAQLAALAASGHPDAAQLAEALRTERGGLWLLLVLALANIVLAVWRPRLSFDVAEQPVPRRPGLAAEPPPPDRAAR
jgi:hypothetical protein